MECVETARLEARGFRVHAAHYPRQTSFRAMSPVATKGKGFGLGARGPLTSVELSRESFTERSVKNPPIFGKEGDTVLG